MDKLGRPAVAELSTAVERLRNPSFDLTGLTPLLRLEFAYLLQLRADQRRSRIPVGDWNRAVRLAIAAGVESVRDRSLEFWQQQVNRMCAARGLFRTCSKP